MDVLHLCPKCGELWTTQWLADNCSLCLPFECDRCGARYPDHASAWLCCRD